MDAIGPAMGMATLPMALLELASVAAGAALIALGDWRPVVAGLVAAVLCYLVARPLERVAIATDDRAMAALVLGRRGCARLFAVASGAVPMLVILAAELEVVRVLTAPVPAGEVPLAFLWAYGVATAPWTWWAARVSRFRRTLASIRAYAAHLALWLFGLALLAGTPWWSAAILAALPAALPVAVGVLLALADRGAISDVRI